MNQSVVLETKTLGELLKCGEDSSKDLSGRLSIPDYQRIYCWQEKNVYQLLEDIQNATNTYHLGCIILHRNEKGVLDIVDGQQRLVTLSLILNELGKKTELLDETFDSSEAVKYIGYNKFIIKKFVDSNKANSKHLNIDNMLKKLVFGVLIINDDNIDLAYTFFSNQNSRGKALTDYELLKAHHLRFINSEDQAKHLAERWDNLLVSSSDNNTDKNLNKTFGTYLFRLRKWMRKLRWDDNQKFKVKTEFEAAPTIKAIPPFGEQFKFYESIQGGTHFFAFAEHFVFQFNVFTKTPEFLSLSKHLSHESHWCYKEVIESLLFAYYLKFGVIYLSDACICIEKIISNHRYQVSRSLLKEILKYASESEIIMMIDQATSPTFFLAEALEKIKKNTPIAGLEGIRKRYYESTQRLYTELESTISLDNFKTSK